MSELGDDRGDDRADGEAETPSRAPPLPPPAWRKNLLLFLATIASVFSTGMRVGEGNALLAGAQFAGTLLTILVAHELGHFIAARLHRVNASLPFFIPLPFFSPFGTMGAVISMPGAIPTRRALLDIGAAGPLAGLVFALPLYAWGAAHSRFIPVGDGGVQLGESIMLKVLDRLFAAQAPEGHELLLHPVAFAAWGGMFVTMINLLPIGQLDGGHVAYALFGPKQDRHAVTIHRAMLAFFALSVLAHLGRDLGAGTGLQNVGRHLANGLFWLVWFQVLAILGLVGGRGRGDVLTPETLTLRNRLVVIVALVAVSSVAREVSPKLLAGAFLAGFVLLLAMERKGGVLRPHALLDHPPTGAVPLDAGRKAIAILTLLFFVLLFMPEPFSM